MDRGMQTVTGLHIASLMGVAAITLPPASETQFWVMCTACITVIGSVVMQVLRNRMEQTRYEHDRQERLENLEEMRQIAENNKLEIMRNTTNRANGLRNDIAARPDRPIETDTNETVHRLEDR
jgi:hypothetical protein